MKIKPPKLVKRAYGWHRDLPDVRDLTPASPEITPLLGSKGAARLAAVRFTHAKGGERLPFKLAAKVDLRPWMSPIEDQGQLGSCTAQAAIGLLEYFERKTLGRHVEGSRRFNYKTSRKLLGWTGDTGAYLRTAAKSLALLGVPPEEHFPYLVAKYEEEPSAFVYALAQDYKALSYYRLDPTGTSGPAALAALKTSLDAQRPAMYGFTVYSSMGNGPNVPMPKAGDKVQGGHAVVAAGYDDAKVIGGVAGAVLFRNSWGTSFGEAGYGWMPYGYFTQRIAVDVWSLVRASYVDLAPFV